eukprot:7390496-Prymnesium_polylepis.1
MGSRVVVCGCVWQSGSGSAEVAPGDHQVILNEHAIVVFDSVQRPAPLVSDLQHLARDAAAVDAQEKDIALPGSHVHG